MHLDPHPHLLRSIVAVIMEMLPNQPFSIIILKLSEKPMQMSKIMFVALVVDVPYQIVDLSRIPH